MQKNDDFMGRLFNELSDLSDKTKKLGAFLDTSPDIPEPQIGLLHAQYSTMKAYGAILHLRIKDLETEK